VVPSGSRPRGKPADDWFVLICTKCGWRSEPRYSYPARCPDCGRPKKFLKEEDEAW
jgi:rubrerythrin